MIPQTEEVLDRFLEWKQSDPKFVTRKQRSMMMGQRQFTIELRVDYADNGKTDTMKKAMQQAARHAYATAVLLADGVKPQVVVFSDDFFTGHEEIPLLEDVIAKGEAAIGATDTQEQISGELLAAATSGTAPAGN